MATINNISEVGHTLAQAAIDNGQTTPVADQPGVSEFTVGGVRVFTSESGITLGGANHADHAVLTGTANANVQGDAHDNLIVGNDGNNDIDAGNGDDQVSTGAGDDNITLGAGDDRVDIDGPGTKVIDSGEGDDLFVIHASAAGSQTTFTGLNPGDKVRINADANGDGKIDLNDVDMTKTGTDANGDTIITLTDGTSFTLEGVKVGPFDGALQYEIGTDEDGNLFVDITDANA
ncbi:MAG: hypothetical protein K9L22_04235 [Methylococcaceae bacterium]|nr:hypothetical protein [Methylococcaceae bacterium]